MRKRLFGGAIWAIRTVLEEIPIRRNFFSTLQSPFGRSASHCVMRPTAFRRTRLILSILIVGIIFIAHPCLADEDSSSDVIFSGSESILTYEGYKRSSEQAPALLTYTLNIMEEYSNETVAEYVCSNRSRILSLAAPSSTTKRYSVPSCINDWSTLETLYLRYMILPAFDLLPASLQMLDVQYSKNLESRYEMPNWDFLDRIASLKTLILVDNQLSGTLPSCPPAHLRNVDFSKNFFSGTISSGFFECGSGIEIFASSNNNLNGTVPTKNIQRLTYFYLGYNKLTHWPDFSEEISSPSASPQGIHNGPNTTLQLSMLGIALNNNQLVEIPSAACFAAMPNLTHLDFSSNPSLNPPAPMLEPQTFTQLALLDVSNCNISAPLPEMLPRDVPNQFPISTRYLSLSGNDFFGPIPESWLNYTWNTLFLSRNIRINSTFPEKLYGPWRLEYNSKWPKNVNALFGLDLSGTSLSGAFALNLFGDYNTSYISSSGCTIQMADLPFLDFCAQSLADTWVPWAADSELLRCYLRGTNAHMCPERYPACSLPPADPIPPLQPSGGPVAPSMPCNPAPGIDENFFRCINGTWTSSGVINSTVLIVPPNTRLKILTNFTTPHIVYTGLSASIVLSSGCIEGLKQVTIELTADDIAKIEKEKGKKKLLPNLLTIEGDESAKCSTDLSLVMVAVKTKSTGCKRVKVSNASNSRKTLGVLFSIDSSRCNLWWIILISVLGGVIILGLVIFMLVAVFVPAVRAKLFSFSRHVK